MIYVYLICQNGHERYADTPGRLKVSGPHPKVVAEFHAVCPTCGSLYVETRTGHNLTRIEGKKNSGTRNRT